MRLGRKLLKVYLAVILVITTTQLFSVVISLSIPRSGYAKVQGEYALGRDDPVISSITLIILAAAIAVIMLRVMNRRVVEWFIKAGLAMVVMLSAIQVFSLLYPRDPYIDLVISVLISISVITGLSLGNRLVANYAYLITGLFVGVFLALFISLSMVPLFILAFAIYDLLMVLKGPLGKLARSISLMLLDFNVIKIGLGDIVFYVLIPSSLTLAKGLLFGIYGVVTTNLGVVATLLLLAKLNRPLPGVTLPALISLPLFYLGG